MCQFQEIDVCWAVQNGQRWSVALNEADALESIRSMETYETGKWQIEKVREVVAIAMGTVVEGKGVAVEFLDDEGRDTSETPYESKHVFWTCPFCNEPHNVSIFRNPLDDSSALTSPSLWFCEHGRGITLVSW
jgi:hypothetical protein